MPTEADEFMIMLKRYVNFMFATFSETSPLFKIIQEVIIKNCMSIQGNQERA